MLEPGPAFSELVVRGALDRTATWLTDAVRSAIDEVWRSYGALDPAAQIDVWRIPDHERLWAGSPPAFTPAVLRAELRARGLDSAEALRDRLCITQRAAEMLWDGRGSTQRIHRLMVAQVLDGTDYGVRMAPQPPPPRAVDRWEHARLQRSCELRERYTYVLIRAFGERFGLPRDFSFHVFETALQEMSDTLGTMTDEEWTAYLLDQEGEHPIGQPLPSDPFVDEAHAAVQAVIDEWLAFGGELRPRTVGSPAGH